MRKRFIVLLFLAVLPFFVRSQELQEFLKQVSENNPEIVAYAKLIEAKRIEAVTGITPPNPLATAGYMPGNTDAIGAKKTWSVTQSFDFPSRYFLQKRINASSVQIAVLEGDLVKLNILLEAEKLVFDLIYSKKALNILKKRKEGGDALLAAWKKMLDNGGTTILDYNKIVLELSAINFEISRLETGIEIIKGKLLFSTGGNVPVPEIEDYPEIAQPELELIISEKSVTHPAFLIPEAEYRISAEEIKLSRTGSLPEFHLGYASEIIPGETYTGPVAGLTIPLWANSGKVKSTKASAIYLAEARDAELFKLKMQTRNDYANMNALKKIMSEVKVILESYGATRYLDVALTNGEISIADYFSYLEAVYRTEERYLEIEKEYHSSLAQLTDYELIK